MKRKPAELDSSPQIKRRNFVQAGLAGAAAALASPPPAPAQRPGSGQGGGRGNRQSYAETPTTATPATPASPETWNEPWVWRPSEWPGQQLDLNVVENQNPGPAVGLGNPNAILFSYGGNTPGPTIRMKGDEILYVKLRNLLGQDFGMTFVSSYPDTATLPPGLTKETVQQASEALGNKRADFCVGEHTNGVHSVRVTNLHTHGLHVRPSRNPNGTHSDNVILRVMSQADFLRREQEASTAPCAFLDDPSEISFLRDDEQAGEADYEFRLGDVQRKMREEQNKKREREGKPPLPPQPHPAGTFWYHPHAHGATHNQVASGMAGYLIVEGDIDEAVNFSLTGQNRPDPTLPTGDYKYRERLMFVQRVLAANRSRDPDAPEERQSLRAGATPLVNGDANPATIQMQPGAVERWRVINGSVDGRGYKRFMVVKGQYIVRNRQLFEVEENGDLKGPIKLPDLERFENKKQQLYQLSVDGVTLLKGTGRNLKYQVKDLSEQGKGTRNPLWDPDPDCPEKLWNNEYGDTLCRLRNVWKNGEHIKNCFVRPNEFYMAPANRTDLFFQAPLKLDRTDKDGNKYAVYTAIAKAVIVHSDTPQQSNQAKFANPDAGGPPSPEDVVAAHIVVSGDEVAGSGDAVKQKVRPAVERVPVQDYLLPIEDKELAIGAKEARARKVEAGLHRTRSVTYSGVGNADFPLLSTYPNDPSAEAFAAFIANDKRTNDGRLENLVYAENGKDAEGQPYYVLLTPNIRTMAIKFDNPVPIDKEHPGVPRKFDPNDPNRARMLESTAEEWALYNVSPLFWGNTTKERKSSTDPIDQNNDPRKKDYKQPPTQFGGHYVSFPISRAEGQKLFDENPDFQVVTKAIDHPFHIHQNPFWMTRLEIPDENGKLHNILDEPRWGDTIWMPRHRGRVVLRSRFPDYVGAYVHHCHILLHEDNGMMNVIEATPFADESNYKAQKKVASESDSADTVTGIYPRATRDEAYVDNARFFDPDESTGQVYPGFEVTPPSIEG